MDSVSSGVMKKISELAGVGRYVIISEDEFTINPDDSQKNGVDLKKALKNLQTAGFIDVKYSGGDLYCVAPLKNFVPEPAEVKEVKIAEKEVGRTAEKPNLTLPFAASFLGGALGSLIISLIFALI